MENSRILTEGPIHDGERRLSLRRFLTIIACFAAFFGFIRLASGNGIGWALLPAVASLALAFGVITRRYMCSLTIVLILAFVSHHTTSIMWDGGFPFAQLKIRIVDENGNPIKNAELSVHRPADGKPATGYPIAEYYGTPLASDSAGVIICHQTRTGLQFGGHAWLLFWCIPMGAKAPQFDVHLDHPKYIRTSVPIRRLFEPQQEFYEDFPKTTIALHGIIEEIPVYEQRIVMSKH